MLHTTMVSMVRVSIVDDHESVRLGLKAACQDAGYEVVVAAATVNEFVEQLGSQECDVVVLDLSLGDGSKVTDNVKRAQATGAAVLVHSIADRVASVREALAAGAAGVIPIDADSDFAKAQLGRRERDVLHLYASGLPLKAVAAQLGIANSTAREYLDRIRVKYVEVGRPAPTKVDLLRRAVEDGILPGLDPDTGNERP